MKHGYACPYHYGALDYRYGILEKGHDCQCEVCTEPDVVVTATTFKSPIRIPWSFRLKLWWRYRKYTPQQREKLAGQIRGIEGKLGNEGFVAKAPAEVVEREKARLADLQRQMQSLDSTLADLG